MDQLVSFFPLILIVLVFWMLVIRPANKRQRDLRTLQSALSPGDRVMLSSGIHGVVRALGEDRVQVEVADGVVLQVARAAIGSRVDTEVATAPDPDNESLNTHPEEYPDTRGDS